jgi:cell division protein FtsB
MSITSQLKRRAHLVLAPIIGVALTGYFFYNLIEGEHGLIRWLSVTREIRAENTNLEAIRTQRQALDLRVSELKPNHLDPDLLDERVRATLNLVAPDEIVIMQPTTSREAGAVESR